MAFSHLWKIHYFHSWLPSPLVNNFPYAFVNNRIISQYKDSNGKDEGNFGFSLSYHTGGRIVSDEKVDFSEFGVITTTKTYLVLVSWILKFKFQNT